MVSFTAHFPFVYESDFVFLDVAFTSVLEDTANNSCLHFTDSVACPQVGSVCLQFICEGDHSTSEDKVTMNLI